VTGPVAVVGGSGKTGRAIRAALAVRRVGAISIGRAEWPRLGELFGQAERTYVVAPNFHEDERTFVSDVLEAARTAGVGRVVYHSVASPYAPDMPHHLGKARAEDVVRRSGLRWTILQPGAYLQNFPLDGSPIRVPYRVDAPFGFAHLPDLGEAAATVLLDDDAHVGATYELASLRATVADVAAAAGAHLDVITPEEGARTMGADLDDRARGWLLAMFAYYEAHGLPAGTVTMATLLGRAPTSLDEAVAT
jgi:NAD(P)H dehydrogenase (quinone)